MARYIETKFGLIIPEAHFAEQQSVEKLDKQPVRSEIATIDSGRDITRGFIREDLILQPTDNILATRGDLTYEIYDDIARDWQVKTCRQQRELALVAKEWFVEPGDDSRQAQKAADRLESQLNNLQWDSKTQKMLSAVLYGYSAAELIWTSDGNEWVIENIKVKNFKRFGFLPNGELRLKTFGDQTAGEALPPGKFWAFSCGADDDDEPYGLGLGHFLYWPVFFKKNGLKFWLTFLEKFGQPTAIGKHPAGATEDEKRRLLQALASIQSSTAIRIPDSMVVELLEATRSGTADYTSLYDRMDAAISKVYLGHTGSTDATPGRLGGESNASEVRVDLIKADADLICGSFNCTVARWLTFYNDGPDVPPPKVWRKTEPPEDLSLMATRDKTIFDMGFKPTIKYISDTYGEGFEIAQDNPPRQNGITLPLISQTGQVDNPAQFSEAERQLSAVDPNTDRLQIEGAKAGKKLVDQIFAFAEKAATLADLRDNLLNAYGDLDASELADVMAIGYSAMNLSGRYDVSEE